MKKTTIRVISTIFLAVIIFAFSACSLFESDSEKNKIYDIGDKYFSATSFEKHVLTSIGVNGHQGSGKSYEIEIIGKCKVALIEYSLNVKLLSADKKVLDTIENTTEKKVAVGTEISIRKEISNEIYTNLDSIEATWCGKSYDDPAKSGDASLNPITYIDLTNNDRTMLVGESFELEYSVTPEDTDEEVEISCGNSSILEITNHTVTAKKVGDTWLVIRPLNKKGSTLSRQICIKVINEFDYNEFEDKFKDSLKKATVSVFCKRYDKNWLGQEKNVLTVSGKGIIVRSAAFANYFLTDKTIFNSVNTDYDYEEWYITDYLGKRYSIAGIQYHKTAMIAIGSFTSSSTYSIAKIYDSYPYEGDYVISLQEKVHSCRIDKTNYMKMFGASSSTKILHHSCDTNSYSRGEAVFNSNGEIIGVNMTNGKSLLAVSSIEIRELYNGIFNQSESSGGGPIDIF